MPWQNKHDPYAIWVSETMLQQTQVKTVAERYPVFMKRFPSVTALANATLDEVMVLWSGLGYYTRARNLHRCAQVIMSQYFGEFPREIESLEALPGIGRSTAGAIAAFAYQARTPILDANVKRVLSRFYGVEGDLQNQKSIQLLWRKAHELLPKVPEKMPAYTQALMDFGATWCTPKQAVCLDQKAPCPMMKHCFAYQRKQVDHIPAKKKKAASPEFQSQMFLIQCGEFILLERRAPKAIWGGLHSLVELPWEKVGEPPKKVTIPNAPKLLKQTILVQEKIQIDYQQIISVEACQALDHIFSHRRLRIYPYRVQLRKKWLIGQTNLIWVQKSKLGDIGLPQPIRVFLESSSR